MMEHRPEHVAFILDLADKASDDVEYQVSLRAWHLRELRNYIKTLEDRNGKP